MLNNVTAPTEVVGDGSKKGKAALIDGDIHTFFAGKKNQAQGDTYQVTLAKAEKVHDVRVCFYATNGDELKGGKVEVSEDGKKWQSLFVKGTSNSMQSNTSHRKQLEDNLYAVDFVAKNPIAAKYVRLVVTQPLTNKWLRLSEIFVNAQHFAQQFVSTVVDKKENAHPELVDGLGRTPLTKVEGKELSYNIDQFLRPTSVTLYWDAASWKGAAPQLSIVENGTTIALSALEGNVATVDLSAHPKATKLVVTWEGSVVPQLYQVVATLDEQGAKNTLTALRQVVAQSSQRQGINGAHDGAVYDLQGQLLRTDGSTLGLPAGVYIVNGQRVMVLKQQ